MRENCSLVVPHRNEQPSKRPNVCEVERTNWQMRRLRVAGVGRFELPRARVKVLCLTAWRYPTVLGISALFYRVHKYVHPSFMGKMPTSMRDNQ